MSGIIFILLVKYSPTNYFLIVFAVIMFIVLLQLESTSSIIDEMINASEEQQEMGDRYIRRLQYRYFTNEYPEISLNISGVPRLPEFCILYKV